MGWIVYGLCDPLSGEIRYVGFTSGALRRRVHEHRYRAKRGRTHLYCWWRSCRSEPHVRVIDAGSGLGEDGLAREREIIRDLRKKGARLTNLTAGGEGTLGFVMPDHARAKISAIQRGRKHSSEHVANQAAALRGRSYSADRRAAIAAGIAARGGRVGRGRRITEQEIADIRATYTGREGEIAAIVRATGWSKTTIKRALSPDLWPISTGVVGVAIEIEVQDRSDPLQNGRSVVTVDVVREMRARYEDGSTIAAVARFAGIGWSQAARIVRRESWVDVA